MIYGISSPMTIPMNFLRFGPMTIAIPIPMILLLLCYANESGTSIYDAIKARISWIGNYLRYTIIGRYGLAARVQLTPCKSPWHPPFFPGRRWHKWGLDLPIQLIRPDWQLLAIHQATSVIIGCYGLAAGVQLTPRKSPWHLLFFPERRWHNWSLNLPIRLIRGFKSPAKPFQFSWKLSLALTCQWSFPINNAVIDSHQAVHIPFNQVGGKEVVAMRGCCRDLDMTAGATQEDEAEHLETTGRK